ncbi:T-complex protein 1 subunit delta [Enteropsectra breve]|nr:T-complex protein 1 subunit delta [Enteropsectra breve]
MKTEREVKINETVKQAVQALVGLLSTSYGPKGLDKMLIKDNKHVVTNDGATIMSYYTTHPIHHILSGVSAAQDTNCGDGTTSVVLLVGCLLEKMMALKERGIHPAKLVEAMEVAKKLALKYINSVRVAIGEDEFVNVALTSLNSKIASKSTKMAEIAVDALKYGEREKTKIIKKTGGNIDDIALYNGILMNMQGKIPEGRQKILVLQFCLSAPKTNIDSKIIINDYSLMEKFVKEEREYIIKLIKAIKKSGATLLVIQKSLLKESVNELAAHFLERLGISYVQGVERKDVEYLCSCLGVSAVSDVELIPEPLEIETEKANGMMMIKGYGRTVVVSGCDQMVVDEAERSLHDAMCVIRSLKDEPFIVPGGGSIETGIAVELERYVGPQSLILGELAEGFLGMPHFLVQNAGMGSLEIVSQLKKNISTNHNFGISLRTGYISDMVNDETVIQPSVVSKSMVSLAIETVQTLLRIDDVLPTIQ